MISTHAKPLFAVVVAKCISYHIVLFSIFFIKTFLYASAVSPLQGSFKIIVSISPFAVDRFVLDLIFDINEAI